MRRARGFWYHWLYWDNGKENGNHYSILGLYWDNVKENGNHYSILGLYWKHRKENGNYYILVVVSRDYEWSPPRSTGSFRV